MSALVYQAINAVAGELVATGIAKNHHNSNRDYAYRGIEDVLNALAPLLARHKLCVLPRVIERQADRGRDADQLVVLRVAFDLVSAIDGSIHIVESFGEAIDDSDKGTAKAMSAAYKAAMLQTFCIPVPQVDGDAASPRRNPQSTTRPDTHSEPPEGWEGWSRDIIEIASSCESSEAIDRLLHARRGQLGALQRSRPDMYAQVGEAIAARLRGLGKAQPSKSAAPARKTKKQVTNDALATTAKAA